MTVYRLPNNRSLNHPVIKKYYFFHNPFKNGVTCQITINAAQAGFTENASPKCNRNIVTLVKKKNHYLYMFNIT